MQRSLYASNKRKGATMLSAMIAMCDELGWWIVIRWSWDQPMPSVVVRFEFYLSHSFQTRTRAPHALAALLFAIRYSHTHTHTSDIIASYNPTIGHRIEIFHSISFLSVRRNKMILLQYNSHVCDEWWCFAPIFAICFFHKNDANSMDVNFWICQRRCPTQRTVHVGFEAIYVGLIGVLWIWTKILPFGTRESLHWALSSEQCARSAVHCTLCGGYSLLLSFSSYFSYFFPLGECCACAVCTQSRLQGSFLLLFGVCDYALCVAFKMHTMSM